MTELNHKYAIYIPSTDNHFKPGKAGHALDAKKHSALADIYSAKMTRLFGGSTVIDAFGAWEDATFASIDGGGLIVKEAIKIVYSFSDVGNDETFAKVKALAERVKFTLAQDAVSVEYDGSLYLI